MSKEPSKAVRQAQPQKRNERLKDALKANLQRRKQQARARGEKDQKPES